ncbi:MAG: helix-turn-helix transcriptional regulator [Planctomycetota bacterium]
MDAQTGAWGDALRATCEVSTALCALPAVATLDWGDRAAEAMTMFAPGCRVCVSIGSIDSGGAFVGHETTGVASRVTTGEQTGTDSDRGVELTLRSKAERLTSLGFRLTDADLDAHAVGTLSELTGTAEWRSRGLGQLWAGVPASDVIVGVARLGSIEPGRAIIVQAALTAPGARANAQHLAVIEAVLPLLVKRALLAIGSRRSTTARWLTTREQQVLEELTLGKSVRQIATEIGRSPHTVHDHVKSLHRKLNASSRGELVARALGYIQEGGRIRDTRPVRKEEERVPEVGTTGAASRVTETSEDAPASLPIDRYQTQG